MFLNDCWSILQNVHFVFLIDIDLIFKIFKILMDGSSSFFGARPFQHCHKLGLPNNEIVNTLFSKIFKVFLEFVKYRCVSKDKNIFVGGLDTSQNAEIIELKSLGLSHKQIEKY